MFFLLQTYFIAASSMSHQHSPKQEMSTKPSYVQHSPKQEISTKLPFEQELEFDYVQVLRENLQTAAKVIEETTTNPTLGETIRTVIARSMLPDFELQPELKGVLEEHAVWRLADKQQQIRLGGSIALLQAELKALELEMEDSKARQRIASSAKQVLDEATYLQNHFHIAKHTHEDPLPL